MPHSVRRLFLAAAWVVLATAPAFAQNDNNGFPAGGHFTLNIQGKTNCAGSGLTGSNRHTIQVLLNVQSNQNDLIDRTNKIYLQPGPPGSQPEVLDGNACDRGGALFQLPIDVSNTWSAYARALSKPETSMNITSCAVDVGPDLTPNTADDIVVCSTGNPLVLTRKSGKPVTINATDELLFVCVGGTGDACTGGTQVPLFADTYYAYFWDVDNFGLRNAQIRLYQD
jgi:hypothetical protein